MQNKLLFFTLLQTDHSNYKSENCNSLRNGHEKFYKYTHMVDSSFTKDNSKGSMWTVLHQDWRLQLSQEILKFFHGKMWIQNWRISINVFFRSNNW